MGDRERAGAEQQLQPVDPRGWLAVLAGDATSSAIVPTTISPASQPITNAGPFARVRGVTSISTTAMIGIGLSATPTASGSTRPMAAPVLNSMPR
jgi:hypothetical protein